MSIFGYSESDSDGYDSREPNEAEQINECPDCGLVAEECTCYSPCCGADIICNDICSQCREHI